MSYQLFYRGQPVGKPQANRVKTRPVKNVLVSKHDANPSDFMCLMVCTARKGEKINTSV